MVFQAIRRYMQGTPLSLSNLYRDSRNILSNCTISLTDKSMKFASSRNCKEILYSKIHRISQSSSKEFTFQLKDDPSVYLYVSNSEIKPLLDEISVFLQPKQSVFEACNATYYVFHNKKGTFQVIGKNCTVIIYKEDGADLSVLEGFNSGSKYILRVDSYGDILHHDIVRQEDQTRTEPEDNAFVWNVVQKSLNFVFKIRFENKKDFSSFFSRYVDCFQYEDKEAEDLLFKSHSIVKSEATTVNDSSKSRLNSLSAYSSTKISPKSGTNNSLEQGSKSSYIENDLSRTGSITNRISKDQHSGTYNENHAKISVDFDKKRTDSRNEKKFIHGESEESKKQIKGIENLSYDTILVSPDSHVDHNNTYTDELIANETQMDSTFLNHSFYHQPGQRYSENEDLSVIFESDSTDEDTEANRVMCVGTNNNIFVGKENKIGIYDNGNKLHYNTDISLSHAPDKIIQHHDKLLTLSEAEKQNIYSVDLETGKVAEKWDISKDVSDCFTATKNIQNNCFVDPTLIGVNSNSIFRIDPRVAKKVVEENNYKTNYNFKYGRATLSGEIAICNDKGELRFYDNISKRAKNCIKGFNETAKGFDVTANKKYALCTFKNYILFYETENTYNKTLKSTDNYRVPKKLCVKPEHIPYINEEINFTAAKFSTNDNEDVIVAATGHFVITWLVNDVLNNKMYNYSIKKYKKKIVADDFGFGYNDQIIVAMKDEVKKVDQKKLKNVEETVRKKILKE